MAAGSYSHIAFADESNWRTGRFRSISLTTATAADARQFHLDLVQLRRNHGTEEFKWKSIHREHGLGLADFLFGRLGKIRMDVLIWDMEDSRHKDLGRRDDLSNFSRMYYHLLHHVLKRRWPDDACWLICPDENKEVNWRKLEECLNWKSWTFEHNLFTGGTAFPAAREFYNISEVRPSCSKKYPLIQLADLFAGLGAYSYTCFHKYEAWKAANSGQASVFSTETGYSQDVSFSAIDKERLPILHHVRETAREKALPLSLKTSRGLQTKNPKAPLNFWLYVPQRPEDRAPVRPTRHLRAGAEEEDGG